MSAKRDHFFKLVRHYAHGGAAKGKVGHKKHFARGGYATDGSVKDDDPIVLPTKPLPAFLNPDNFVQSKLGVPSTFLSYEDVQTPSAFVPPAFGSGALMSAGLPRPSYTKSAKNEAINIAKSSSPLSGLPVPEKYLPPGHPDRAANLDSFYGKTPAEIRNSNWYHWSPNSFDQFRPMRSDEEYHFVSKDPTDFEYMGGLHYISQSQGENRKYTVDPKTNPQVYPLHVRAENPFDYQNPKHIENIYKNTDPSKIHIYDDYEGEYRLINPDYYKSSLQSGDWKIIEHPEVQNAIKAAGHDSFFVNEKGGKNLAVYDPGQLKSRIGNRGTFDPESKNIKEARGGFVRQNYATDGAVQNDDQQPTIDQLTANLPGATIGPSDPSIRDRIANFFLSSTDQPSVAQQEFVGKLMGSKGAGTTGFGLADLVPGLGQAMGAQEAYRQGDMKGVAMSVLPGMPASRTGMKAIQSGERILADELANKALPPIPRATNLTPEHSEIEGRFADAVAKDPQGMMAKYGKIIDDNGENITNNGKILNTDNARELSPDYAASKDSKSLLSAAVHEPASWLTKWMYAQKLQQHPRENELPMVLFTAGGTGAGKSTAIRDVPGVSNLERKAQIVFDTNMNGYNSSKQKIDQALDAGKNVTVAYVYRDPIDALVNGSLPRAMRMGRTVPLQDHLDTHIGSADTIRRLAAEYADHPNVDFQIINNSLGRGKAQLGSLDTIDPSKYNITVDDLRSVLESEYRNGKISEPIYRGTLGSYTTGKSYGGAASHAGSPKHRNSSGTSSQNRLSDHDFRNGGKASSPHKVKSSKIQHDKRDTELVDRALFVASKFGSPLPDAVAPSKAATPGRR